MMFPYRVKNPVRTAPLATYGLVVVNVIVFGLTCGGDLAITEEVVRRWAFSGGPEWLFRSFTSQFLHGDLLHLVFNMYFLWLFAPAVEDRLGHGLFLGLYFGAGLVGDLLQWLVSGADLLPTIGASGAVSGVLGAYWYLFSWSPVCVLFRWFLYVRTLEIRAVWFILFYVLMDVLGVVSSGGGGGVAHSAHLGGVLFGLMLPAALRLKRDDAAVSEVKAMQSDGLEPGELPLSALETLMEHTPDDPTLFSALVLAAAREKRPGVAAAAFQRAPEKFIEECPVTVSTLFLDLGVNARLLTAVQVLRLAGKLGAAGDDRAQTQILQLLLHTYPRAPECDTALLRLARLYLERWKDRGAAKMYLQALLGRAPSGPLADEARALLARIGGR